jgi:hypothetical protein
MSVLNNSLLLGADAAAGGYSISRSLRFNAADSAYLSRTPASAGNRKTWTWAGWVKRSKLSGAIQKIFTAGTSGSSHTGIQITSGEQLEVFHFAGSYVFQLVTTQVLRDLSAWMHIAVAVDSTQATSSNRVKVYINGSQVTAFATSSYPVTQNADYEVNNTSFHAIAKSAVTGESNYVDAYLADIHFCDGTAYDASAFGEFSATTGVWMPKQFTGSYGSQGWKLDFADNSAATATTLGKDSSGNGNNWTPNNLSVTAGAGNDSLVDVPVNGSEVDTGAGGQVRGNYCTLNPLLNGSGTLANGNLELTGPSSAWGSRVGTVAISSGKWYFEAVASTGATSLGVMVGITKAVPAGNHLGIDANGYAYFSATGNKWNNGSGASYGATWTDGDVIGCAFDADVGTLTFYKNGVSQGTAYSSLSASLWFLGVSCYGSAKVDANWGARPFAYTAPSGFKALCTANLPAPVVTKPSTVMDVATWAGNNGTQTISLPGGFNPDLVWVKNRSGTTWHTLVDSVRGTPKELYSNATNAEVTSPTASNISNFQNGSFDVGPGSSDASAVNATGSSYVGWTWDAGSSTVTNTQGSISSQVRANASAGFSIVNATWPSSGAFTIGHGLGVMPSFIISKARTAAFGWTVYHASLGSGKYLDLNTTSAATSNANVWGTHTSSVVSLGSVMASGQSSIMYCFAPVAGYSSFGSYTGNGSTDGPFVYTGFRPRWIMLKRADSNSSWAILDATRLGYNVRNDSLYANLADAEANFGLIDILSNGFKLRATFGSENGGTHIYCAFAEHPFQYARAR